MQWIPVCARLAATALAQRLVELQDHLLEQRLVEEAEGEAQAEEEAQAEDEGLAEPQGLAQVVVQEAEGEGQAEEEA